MKTKDCNTNPESKYLKLLADLASNSELPDDEVVVFSKNSEQSVRKAIREATSIEAICTIIETALCHHSVKQKLERTAFTGHVSEPRIKFRIDFFQTCFIKAVLIDKNLRLGLRIYDLYKGVKTNPKQNLEWIKILKKYTPVNTSESRLHQQYLALLGDEDALNTEYRSLLTTIANNNSYPREQTYTITGKDKDSLQHLILKGDTEQALINIFLDEHLQSSESQQPLHLIMPLRFFICCFERAIKLQDFKLAVDIYNISSDLIISAKDVESWQPILKTTSDNATPQNKALLQPILNAIAQKAENLQAGKADSSTVQERAKPESRPVMTTSTAVKSGHTVKPVVSRATVRSSQAVYKAPRSSKAARSSQVLTPAPQTSKAAAESSQAAETVALRQKPSSLTVSKMPFFAERREETPAQMQEKYLELLTLIAKNSTNSKLAPISAVAMEEIIEKINTVKSQRAINICLLKNVSNVQLPGSFFLHCFKRDVANNNLPLAIKIFALAKDLPMTKAKKEEWTQTINQALEKATGEENKTLTVYLKTLTVVDGVDDEPLYKKALPTADQYRLSLVLCQNVFFASRLNTSNALGEFREFANPGMIAGLDLAQTSPDFKPGS